MDRSPAVVRGRSRVCAVAVAAAVAGALPGAAATCAAPWSVPSMKPSFSPRLVPLMVDCSAQICTKSHAPEKKSGQASVRTPARELRLEIYSLRVEKRVIQTELFRWHDVTWSNITLPKEVGNFRQLHRNGVTKGDKYKNYDQSHVAISDYCT